MHHYYRGGAGFSSFTVPDIIWLLKTKHVELQERKTICYIFANNAEIKTIQCVWACYNMLLPVINGGLKIKKPKRSKDPHRQPDYPNYHMRRIHMSPLMLAWWSVCDSIRLKNYASACEYNIRGGWKNCMYIDRTEWTGCPLYIHSWELRNAPPPLPYTYCESIEQMRGLYQFRFQYNISQMCTSAERVRSVCTAYVYYVHTLYICDTQNVRLCVMSKICFSI